MRLCRPVLPLALALLASAAAAPAQPADSGEVRATPGDAAEGAEPSVRELFETARFEECAEVGRQRVLGAPDEREPDRMDRETEGSYLVACLLQLGRTSDAEELIEALLEADPSLPPPSGARYGAEVEALFETVRDRWRAEREAERDALIAAEAAAEADRRAREQAERERQARLLELASTETVLVQNHRWIAAVPYGVGQFQNGDRGMGWFLFGSELLATGALIGGLAAEVQFNAVQEGADPDQLNRALGAARTTWQVGMWSLIGLGTLGIVHAELRFVPERRSLRRRTLPDDLLRPACEPTCAVAPPTSAPSDAPLPAAPEALPPPPEPPGFTVTPTVSGAPGGVTVGLAGRF